MSNKVSGIIGVIEPTKTYGQKGFRKRLVVLEQELGSFTNYVPVDVTRDMCDEVDELNIGDEVEFAFRLSGRKWQKDEQSEAKYFLNAEAMSYSVIKSVGGGAANTTTKTTGDDEVPF